MSRASASAVSVRRRARGFTLIEVIIAFALLALALTLLLGTLSSAARQVGDSDGASHASLYAQSLFDSFGVGEPLRPGRSDGELDDGRYRWTLQVQPYVDPQAGDPALRNPSAPRLLQLDLQMRWGDAPRQQAHWRTLRLVPAEIDSAGTLP
ncbi:general secretion pathway protein GspI [Pseudoxanthomonas kalamensis DSM 18571]|uniref:type II secretion system protein XpsI n=1 Tax=Pseudoxanthomonas kalamensis TaxID=289483 RepID=UPI001391B596|nr:prepilin-type N-terminal cleavage/methylation domain-containing protein [Pseudoxanthomonas kalamensis]KAF1708873.1 general secretion pathway protein GspI [Pseudoxanthomonas kalamensis DSM 18571]